RALSPVIWAMNELANLLLRLCGVEPKSEVASAFTAEEVAAIIERSQQEGVLHDELGLLSGALEFSAKDAAEVMVADENLVTLAAGATPASLEAAVAQTGFSRFPVRNSRGVVDGYLHIKDVLYADEAARDVPIPRWRLRGLPRVAPSEEIEEVLRGMQRTGTPPAVVPHHGGQPR